MSENPKSHIPSAGAIFAWLFGGVPLLLCLGLASGVGGVVLGAYLSYSQGLPGMPDLRAYRPKTVSTFYAEDGTVIGMFYREKRFPISLDSMPDHVVNAFIAAEDNRFYSHPGVDWIGIGRALMRDISTGTFSQGGSTITQQLTRNFLLSKEKKLSRKIREVILSFRLEKTLTKREILELYINEIFMGKRSYGIEAAARSYFGKTTKELTIAEAAFLAGIVASPSLYSPARNLEGALRRREYVLGNMERLGLISEEDHRKASAEAPAFKEPAPDVSHHAPYFTEAVRQYILATYGEEKLYNEGLQVWTTVDLDLQGKGAQAVFHGAMAWENRQGRPPGLLRKLRPAEARAFLHGPAQESRNVGDWVYALVMENTTPKPSRKSKTVSDIQTLTVSLSGNVQHKVSLSGRGRYQPNDLLLLRVTEKEGNRVTLSPTALPPIEGALVCIENSTGHVKALVGGLDYQRSSFNRAVQAVRQPGSSFKPYVYAAALEWGHYVPQTVIMDEPIAVAVDRREPYWIPTNADGRFAGAVSLRQAVANSRNIPAVKVLMDVGPEAAIRMAKAMGVTSSLRKNLSLGLGTSEVSPLDHTAAYTVFPNMGTKVRPVLVEKVLDRYGTALEDNTGKVPDVDASVTAAGQAGLSDESGRGAKTSRKLSAAVSSDKEIPRAGVPGRSERVMSPQTAYLMVSVLREVCVSGTAAKVNRMARKDLAGKTGTTDDYTDSWFVGFSPEYTTGVWMGFDAKISLGREEGGRVTALPVWMEFMEEALRGRPFRGYPVPPGIVFTSHDGRSHRGSVPDLLGCSPTLARSAYTKQLSPVDAAAGQASMAVDPMTGRPVLGSYSGYGGMAGAMDPWGYGAHMQGQAIPGVIYLDPMTGQPIRGGRMSGGYPGTLRVLSTTGQTLGYAAYGSDRRGKIAIQEGTVAPARQWDTEPDQPHPWAGPGSRVERHAGRQPQEDTAHGGSHQDRPPPIANQFLRHLPGFLIPFFGGGWGQ